MSTVDQFVRKMDRTAVELARADRVAVERAAFTMKQYTLASLRRAAPSGRLRGVGKKGARLGVRYDVKGQRNPVALVRATGPWQFIENDTKAHQIPKARGRRARKRYAVTPYGVFARVNHPGTKGKHPWRLGVAAGTPRAEREVRSSVTGALARGLRG